MRSEKLAYLAFYKSEFGVAKHCSKSFGYAVWNHRQTEVDEARAKAQMCRDEKTHAINRWSAVCKERDELQKRVDAALKLIESWNEIAFDKTTHWTEGYEEGCYHCAAQLEQALKGGEDASN